MEKLFKKESFETIWEANTLLNGLKEQFDWGFKNNEEDLYAGMTAVLSLEKAQHLPPGYELKGSIKNHKFHSKTFECQVQMSDSADAMIYVCINQEIIVLTR